MLIESALKSQEGYSQSARSPFRIYNQVLFLLSWPHTTRSTRTSTPRLRGADLRIPLTGTDITLEQRMTRRQIPGRHSQIPTSVASFPSQQVGTYEEDFMHKPPYEWKSEGDLFKVKNYS